MYFRLHGWRHFAHNSVGLEKAAAVTSAAVNGCCEIIGWLPAVDVVVAIADSAVI